MQTESRQLAVVTGAATGLGLEFARLFAEQGYDLLVAAEQPLRAALRSTQALDVPVEALLVDLSSAAGLDALHSALAGRTVDVLAVNVEHGNAKAFLDQDIRNVRHALDAHIIGTACLLHRIGNDMRRAGHGRILVAQSAAGAGAPGDSGTGAFLVALTQALRNELKDSGVTVTCVTQQAGSVDTEELAETGFETMMNADGSTDAVVSNGDRGSLSGPHLDGQ